MFEDFYHKIKKTGYRSRMDDPVIVQGWCLHNVPVAQRVPALLLLGPAGTGKTFFAECFSRALSFSLLSYQCHYGTGKEELLYDLDVQGVVERLAGGREEISSYLRPGILPTAVQTANELADSGRGVVLLLDEVEKTRPEVDAFLLDFLQSGRIYDPHLGEFVLVDGAKLYVIATSNQDRLLSEPLMRRFRRVYIKYPPPEVEVEIIRRATKEYRPHPAFIKGIVKIVGWLRRQEDVMKPPSTPELINLVRDVLSIPSPEARAQVAVSWLCAYEEDQQILLKKYPLSWWRGMLRDEEVKENV